MSTTSTTNGTFHIEELVDSKRGPRTTWRVQQDISDIFDALDELKFDLDPFGTNEATKKNTYDHNYNDYDYEYKPLPPLPALPSSTCIDSTQSDTSSLSFIFAQRFELEKAYNESIRPKDVVRDTVRQKVEKWLAQLPERHDVAQILRKDAMQSFKRQVTKRNRRQASEPINSIPSPQISDDTTIAVSDDCKLPFNKTDSIQMVGKQVIDRGDELDGYHSALLHIHRPSKSLGHNNFRPSLRRQYPRGLEDEARLGIGVARPETESWI
ncbi:hypothetical protein NW768_011793 [Fusarium equiseti]|uniref:Uncharacterized protein n=1 Tax=Fusarium equiseti TaxID=61235 RepID=A0ABQ8QWW3_FUSEQ|nr:hypothetical protein NW768_011793 [Fusarium equiseti]